MCVALGCVSQELPSAILYSQKQFALCEDEREDHPLCTTHSCRFYLCLKQLLSTMLLVLSVGVF